MKGFIKLFAVTIDQHGSMRPDDPIAYRKYCKQFFAGQRVLFGLQPIEPDKPKTLNQNAFFHGVAVPFIAELAGYNPNYSKDLVSVRNALKESFGPKVEVVSFITGDVSMQPKSIADYTKDDYTQLIDNCDMYCYDTYQCRLPEPQSVQLGA